MHLRVGQSGTRVEHGWTCLEQHSWSRNSWNNGGKSWNRDGLVNSEQHQVFYSKHSVTVYGYVNRICLMAACCRCINTELTTSSQLHWPINLLYFNDVCFLLLHATRGRLQPKIYPKKKMAYSQRERRRDMYSPPCTSATGIHRSVSVDSYMSTNVDFSYR